MRTRLVTALILTSTTMLVSASDAFAKATGGEGWYGETNDKVITNVMFLVILFFPTVALVFSVIQWGLDRRKHAKMDAQKRREANADWRGGW
jgi:hypothetical protein